MRSTELVLVREIHAWMPLLNGTVRVPVPVPRYSWRTRTLMSTGFGLSAGASRTRRKKAWRNCSASGDRTSAADPCTGPVAFAKGPLLLISTSAVKATVESALFVRDVAQVRSYFPLTD